MPAAPDEPAPAAGPAAAPAERWLREHGDVLWRFVLARVRSRDAAEDIVQETVLAAMRSHASFAGGSSERTWLIGIAAHKVADHFRAARRRAGDAGGTAEENSGPEIADTTGMFTAGGAWARPPTAWGMDAGAATENAEMLSALRRCIGALPPSQAEAVWLRDLLDIPGDEVCKAMGISPTNLWTRLHRARAALRACVEKRLGMSREDAR
ncbi:MAG: sigma-70 family RNA polymerase sigma factor [Phycisphaerales bacterium]